jgi:hypothetical protein
MVKTKTRKVAQVLSKATGRGHMIFNDRLANGTRSLKVWGWTGQDYIAAQELLRGMGCKVELVEQDKYSTRGGCTYTMRRLHIVE